MHRAITAILEARARWCHEDPCSTLDQELWWDVRSKLWVTQPKSSYKDCGSIAYGELAMWACSQSLPYWPLRPKLHAPFLQLKSSWYIQISAITITEGWMELYFFAVRERYLAPYAILTVTWTLWVRSKATTPGTTTRSRMRIWMESWYVLWVQLYIVGNLPFWHVKLNNSNIRYSPCIPSKDHGENLAAEVLHLVSG